MRSRLEPARLRQRGEDRPGPLSPLFIRLGLDEEPEELPALLKAPGMKMSVAQVEIRLGGDLLRRMRSDMMFQYPGRLFHLPTRDQALSQLLLQARVKPRRVVLVDTPSVGCVGRIELPIFQKCLDGVFIRLLPRCTSHAESIFFNNQGIVLVRLDLLTSHGTGQAFIYIGSADPRARVSARTLVSLAA